MVTMGSCGPLRKHSLTGLCVASPLAMVSMLPANRRRDRLTTESSIVLQASEVMQVGRPAPVLTIAHSGMVMAAVSV